MPKQITIETIRKAGKGPTPAFYLVRDERGTIIGQLEKYKNTRSDKHPWKAFKGTGYTRQWLGAFYEADGGKQAAIAAICA